MFRVSQSMSVVPIKMTSKSHVPDRFLLYQAIDLSRFKTRDLEVEVAFRK